MTLLVQTGGFTPKQIVSNSLLRVGEAFDCPLLFEVGVGVSFYGNCLTMLLWKLADAHTSTVLTFVPVLRLPWSPGFLAFPLSSTHIHSVKKTMLSSISISHRAMLCRQPGQLKASALRHCVVSRAVEGDNPFTGSQAAESSAASPKAAALSPADAARAADEARLESAEKSARRARQQSAPQTPRRQIPILGVDKPEVASSMAAWKEGALFPEGFDAMPTDKKLNELYMGQRGFLFW